MEPQNHQEVILKMEPFKNTRKLNFPGAGFSFFEPPRSSQTLKTCLSMGTGSALKNESLQSDGLKAVLATAVVFGRACGAASTTLANEKAIEKTWTKFRK